MWSQLCNALASYNTRWREHINLTRRESVNFARTFKAQTQNSYNGARELKKIIQNKTRLDDPEFKYVPAAKTDIRATIKREQRRLEESRRGINEKLSD